MSASGVRGGGGGKGTRGRGRGRGRGAGGKAVPVAPAVGARKCITFTAAEAVANIIAPSPRPDPNLEQGSSSSTTAHPNVRSMLMMTQSHSKKKTTALMSSSTSSGPSLIPADQTRPVEPGSAAAAGSLIMFAESSSSAALEAKSRTMESVPQAAANVVHPGSLSVSAAVGGDGDDVHHGGNDTDLCSLTVSDDHYDRPQSHVASAVQKVMAKIPNVGVGLKSSNNSKEVPLEFVPAEAPSSSTSSPLPLPLENAGDIEPADSEDEMMCLNDSESEPSGSDDDAEWIPDRHAKRPHPSSSYTSPSPPGGNNDVNENEDVSCVGAAERSQLGQVHYGLFSVGRQSTSAPTQKRQIAATHSHSARPKKTSSQTLVVRGGTGSSSVNPGSVNPVPSTSHDESNRFRTATGPPTHKHQSLVWNYFSCPDASKPYLVRCTLCGKRISRGTEKTSSLGTTPMRRHMIASHNREWRSNALGGTESANIQHQQESDVGNVHPSLSLIGHDVAAEQLGEDRPSPSASQQHQRPGHLTQKPSPLVPPKRSIFAPPLSRQPSLTESLERAKVYHRTHDRVRLLNGKLAKMLAVEMLPFSFVEKKGFRELMAAADPRWQIPSRSYFTRKAVPDLYHEVLRSVGNALAQSESRKVHLTTDIWTSQQSVDYMAVTAHWVTFPPARSTSQQLQSHQSQSQQKDKYRHQATLCMDSFGGQRHTSSNLLQKLRQVAGQWLIPRKLDLGCVASDNASNIVAALREGQIVHIPCFAHVLHLVVTRFVSQNTAIERMLTVARKICSHFCRSYKSRNVLRDLQRSLKLPAHQLKIDVPTRWNSTLYMLERLHEQSHAVTEFCNKNLQCLGDAYLTPFDWQLMSHLCSVLRPFEEATLIVSESNAGVNQILPLIYILQTKLIHIKLECQMNGEESKAELVEDLLSCFLSDSRIKAMQSSEVYLLSTFLDPRFKMTVGEMGRAPIDSRDLSITKSGEAEEATVEYCKQCLVSRLERSLAEIAQQEGSRMGGLQSEGSSVCAQSSSSQQPRRAMQSGPFARQVERSTPGERLSAPTVKTSLWGLCTEYGLSKVSIAKRRQRGPSPEEMVSAYLNDTIELGTEDDPLDYWQSKKRMWHQALISIAIECLSCPPASVQSERVFSAAGAIVTDRRTSLSSRNVEKLAFLKMNEHHIPANYGSHPLQLQLGTVRTGSRASSEARSGVHDDDGGDADEDTYTFSTKSTPSGSVVVESDDDDEWDCNSDDDDTPVLLV